MENGAVTLWDIETGAVVDQFRGHSGTVRELAFSPDGATLYTVSPDRSLLAWDLDGSRRFVAEQQRPRPLTRTTRRHPQWRADRLRQWSRGKPDAMQFLDLAVDEMARKSRSATAASETSGPDRRIRPGRHDRERRVRPHLGTLDRHAPQRARHRRRQARLQRRRRTDPRRRRRRRGRGHRCRHPRTAPRHRSSSTTASSAFRPAPTTAPRSP